MDCIRGCWYLFSDLLLDLLPRALVPFGQHQDRNFQSKILGVPVSRRMRALVHNMTGNFIVSFHSCLPLGLFSEK